MKNMLRISSLLLICIFTAFAACEKEEPLADPTLYERLGGINAISAVVDQFITNVVGDNVINARFAETVANPSRAQLLRNNLIDQICAGAGGPCQYKGKNMVEAHTGMNITEAEFNALVGDLVAALNSLNVPKQEQDDLLAILGPMKTDIVGK